jgi:hypothetical protein
MPPVVVGTSGDIDCLGRTDQPQEFLKNLLSIRQGVGRNLATSATTTDPGQGFKSDSGAFHIETELSK